MSEQLGVIIAISFLFCFIHYDSTVNEFITSLKWVLGFISFVVIVCIISDAIKLILK